MFALELNGALHVTKGYDSLGPTKELSITITSLNLVGLYAYNIIEEIVKNNFIRKFV